MKYEAFAFSLQNPHKGHGPHPALTSLDLNIKHNPAPPTRRELHLGSEWPRPALNKGEVRKPACLGGPGLKRNHELVDGDHSTGVNASRAILVEAANAQADAPPRIGSNASRVRKAPGDGAPDALEPVDGHEVLEVGDGADASRLRVPQFPAALGVLDRIDEHALPAEVLEFRELLVFRVHFMEAASHTPETLVVPSREKYLYTASLAPGAPV